MSEAITFLAAFPPIQSAIKLDGSGGARIQLDIPESEMGNFIKAMMWRGKRLRVTLEEDTENWTKLDANDEKQADERPERRTSRMGRRRS